MTNKAMIDVAGEARALADVIARHIKIVPQGRGGELPNGITIRGSTRKEHEGKLLYVFNDADRFEYHVSVDAAALLEWPEEAVKNTLRNIYVHREQARRARQEKTSVELRVRELLRRDPAPHEIHTRPKALQ